MQPEILVPARVLLTVSPVCSGLGFEDGIILLDEFGLLNFDISELHSADGFGPKFFLGFCGVQECWRLGLGESRPALFDVREETRMPKRCASRDGPVVSHSRAAGQWLPSVTTVLIPHFSRASPTDDLCLCLWKCLLDFSQMD